MTNEIGYTNNFYSGDTLYFRVLSKLNKRWNTASTAFEATASGNIGDYDISLTEEASTGHFKGDFPSTITEGSYYIEVCKQGGASPAWSDVIIAEGFMNWDGDEEVGLGDVYDVSDSIDAFTYTLTRSDNGNPIEDATVTVTTDASGDSIVATSITNTNGKVTFYLSPDTYYFWRSHPDYSFSDPDTEVIS